MSERSIGKRWRVILYGQSVILGTIGAILQKRPQFEVISMQAQGLDVHDLESQAPDAILFDLQSGYPAIAFALLANCPGMQLIGIDPDKDRVQVWYGQQLHELSVQDLIEVIHKRDTEIGGHGGTGSPDIFVSKEETL